VENLQSVIDTLNKTGKREQAKEYQVKLNGYMKDVDKILEEWKNIEQ
jgi:hypothetical protein